MLSKRNAQNHEKKNPLPMAHPAESPSPLQFEEKPKVNNKVLQGYSKVLHTTGGNKVVSKCVLLFSSATPQGDSAKQASSSRHNALQLKLFF